MRSSTRMRTPPTIHATTTGHGPNRVSSILLSKAAPSTAAGRKAITSVMSRWRPSGLRPTSPWIICTNRRQKRPRTARMAPNWMAMAYVLTASRPALCFSSGRSRSRDGDEQVAGGRDRQVLGDALDDPEDRRLPPRQQVVARRRDHLPDLCRLRRTGDGDGGAGEGHERDHPQTVAPGGRVLQWTRHVRSVSHGAPSPSPGGTGGGQRHRRGVRSRRRRRWRRAPGGGPSGGRPCRSERGGRRRRTRRASVPCTRPALLSRT